MKKTAPFLLILFFLISGIAGLILTGKRTVAPPTPFGAVPNQAQLNWHELEVFGMVNFSTITYYGREWGYGDEDPAQFNPTEFDALQIVRAAKAGGLKGLIIDAKHHGGFCLWPSRFNDDYSVKNSPWRNGKGDMVRELAEACRAEGLQVGMYLSPWDRHHKDYGKPEYVTYFHNQLKELLTQYGPLFEVWFDGANGGDGWYGGAKETRKIDRKSYYRFDQIIPMVRELQSGASIFSDIGPEARWCGNEKGYSGDPCWATFTPKYGDSKAEVKINPKTGIYDGFPLGNSNYDEAPNGHKNGNFWIPNEDDFPLRQGWFWSPDNRGNRTPEQMVDLYFCSVGLNSAMDIGIAPDRRGRIDEHDQELLREFGERIRAIFKTNLALGAKASASNYRGKASEFAASQSIAGTSKFGQYWATDDKIKDAELILDFGKSTKFSVISLREPISLGHRIDNWALDAWKDGRWSEFASGRAIGARRLWRGQPIGSSKIRLRITGAMASPAISEFAVYLEPVASDPKAAAALKSLESGLNKEGWKVVSCTSNSASALPAIDNDPDTFWHTSTSAGCQAPPQEIAIDMGKMNTLSGFLYTPRRDGNSEGNVTRYLFLLSIDGQSWTEAARGEFSNIRANPVQQKVAFAKKHKARYFKFVATAAIDDCVNVAELGVVEK